MMNDDKHPPVINLPDWKARTKLAKNDETTVTAPPSIGSAMRSSAIYVLAAMGVLAVFLALPLLSDAVSWAWYGWARLITREYSDVTPALWINWLTLIAAAWSLGVAYKLGNAKFDLSTKFAGVMVVLLIFGAIPASCALFASAVGMVLPSGSYPLMAKMALLSAGVTWLLVALGVAVALIATIVIVSDLRRD